MLVKYSKHFLNSLEEIFAESDYNLRYEKGNFKAGYCILKENKIAIVNKYYPIEGKINSLIEMLKALDLDTSGLSSKSRKLYLEINQMELQF